MPQPFPDDPTYAPTPPPPSERSRFAQSASPVNMTLIVVSVIAAIWTQFGENREHLHPWLISLEPFSSPDGLRELAHGEVWRLLSPMFLHFGVAHLAFNMINMVMLGAILEKRIGSGHYLLLTAGLGTCSNLGQYYFGESPYFGGMSGVVYGLIGYIWLRGKLDWTFGLMIPRQGLMWALGWFVLCVVGVIPNVANYAHGVGLALGALWGTNDSREARQNARKA